MVAWDMTGDEQPAALGKHHSGQGSHISHEEKHLSPGSKWYYGENPCQPALRFPVHHWLLMVNNGGSVSALLLLIVGELDLSVMGF